MVEATESQEVGEHIDHFSFAVLGSLSSLELRPCLAAHPCDPAEEAKLPGEQQGPDSRLCEDPVDRGRCVGQI